MNSLAKLIQSNLISFKEVFLENYKVIGLSDAEAMIILHLYQQTKKQDYSLSIIKLTNMMSEAEKVLDEQVVSLIARGYIDLMIDDSGVEIFSLLPTMERLGVLLQDANKQIKNRELQSQIIEYFEKIFKQNLKSNDLVIINQWVTEKYELDDIKAAIIDSYKNNKKASLAYVDALLLSRNNNKQREKAEINPEFKDLLDSINVRRKYN